jgi:uncharacterized OB-fold protein
MSTEQLLSDPYVAAFPELQIFWAAAERDVLLLPRCTQCGEVHWHPRPQCPFCRCEVLNWEEASGRGTLHTFTVIERRAAPPDLLAYVRLQEGILVLTGIVDCEPAQLRIGMPVRVVFQATPEGRKAPFFTAAAAG